MSQKMNSNDATLDRWLQVKEIPDINMRFATKQEIEKIGSQTLAFYIRAQNTVVLTPNLRKEKFDKIVSVINHEILHHILTTFVSGKASRQMDCLVHVSIKQVGPGNRFSVRFCNMLDLERFKKHAGELAEAKDDV
jgi:predicted SprT family Zn-dependent metalloprotease